MGIRDKPIASASPWQNGFAERLIGSIRRECLDHSIVSGEFLMPLTTTRSEGIGRCTRMRRLFVQFNRSESFAHTRSSAGFTITTSGFEFLVHTGAIVATPVLGGFHHRYMRM
jgi:hypothetical protein